MTIKIKFERTLVRGEKRIVVRNLDALPYARLPAAYADSADGKHFCLNGASFLCTSSEEHGYRDSDGYLCNTLLREGNAYTEAEFYSRVAYIKKCGERLEVINTILADVNADNTKNDEDNTAHEVNRDYQTYPSLNRNAAEDGLE